MPDGRLRNQGPCPPSHTWRPVLLDADKLFCKLHFSHGLDSTNRASRSRRRLLVSPAGSGVLLWPVSARPFARTAPPRHRGTPGRPAEMASRRRARPRTPCHLLPHGRIPAPRSGDLRFPRRVGRPKAARSVSPLFGLFSDRLANFQKKSSEFSVPLL